MRENRLRGLMVRGTDPTAWKARHNKAVLDYLQLREPKAAEQVVLSLAEHIELLLLSDWGTDGYVEPNCTVPVMQAFRDLLNIDLGRLDGGTLDSWLMELARAHDIEEEL